MTRSEHPLSPYSPEDQRLVREFLAAHDVRCPVCAYMLAGTPEAVCPECAEPLRLELTSQSAATLGPWLFAVISFSLGLGFFGTTSAIQVAVFMAHQLNRQSTGVYVFFTSTLIGALMCGVLLRVTIRARPRWQAQPLARQRRWAWGVFASVCVAQIAFAAYWFFVR